MTPPPPKPEQVTSGKAKAREWAPRIWEGCDYFTWWKLLAANRFAVEPAYWYIAAIVSCSTFAHMVLRWVQHGLYGDRVAETPIPHAPLFVIGHWRTGTTLLHELLILDDRHTCPDTFACFVPHHTLISEHFFKTQLRFLIAEKRPMDNMPLGWDRPQEDEFALCLLGQPSTYTDIAFPNRPPMHPGALDLTGLTPGQLAAWKRTFRRFVQTLAFKDPRRLVLKSPPHTARIPVLLELFPDARFVHIVRDPYVLFPSTVNLWLSMAKRHGLQTPRGGPALEEKVFREFRVIHERYEEGKTLIPPGRLVEVRYEELVKDLTGTVRRVYDGLGLGGFEAVRPMVAAYAERYANYETNKYPLTDELRARITDRWGDIIGKLGYGERPTSSSSPPGR
jgi:hypothetical protein